MSILSKILNFIKSNRADIILLVGVLLISLISFSAGYITAKSIAKEPIKIENTNF